MPKVWTASNFRTAQPFGRLLDSQELSVPGIDLYSIGPNDFAQSLGYPGQPDHPEVVRTIQEIAGRIRRAGRRMQADVMQAAWVSDMLLDAGRRILEGNRAVRDGG